MKKVSERDANYGKKTIEVRVRFFTDSIADTKGKIIPKVCWDGGAVFMIKNEAHGIVPQPPEIFNTMTEIVPKIETVLRQHGVKVVRSVTAKKLYTSYEKLKD